VTTLRVFAVAGILVAGLCLPAHAAARALEPLPVAADSDYVFTVGEFKPAYEPPSPGSYELPPIRRLHDHSLVDSAGRDTTLDQVIDGRIAVVSFVYGTCGERAGCPLATAVLHRLDRRLTSDPNRKGRVALVSISFDPARDTPARLTEREKMAEPGSTWRFVTARDEAALQPILDDFGQSISKLHRSDGSWTGQYRHVLKVYLLDRRRQVRNIYSVGMLNPDLLWNDIETLNLEKRD
jgi:cytochrome c peroxidase